MYLRPIDKKLFQSAGKAARELENELRSGSGRRRMCLQSVVAQVMDDGNIRLLVKVTPGKSGMFGDVPAMYKSFPVSVSEYSVIALH